MRHGLSERIQLQVCAQHRQARERMLGHTPPHTTQRHQTEPVGDPVFIPFDHKLPFESVPGFEIGLAIRQFRNRFANKYLMIGKRRKS